MSDLGKLLEQQEFESIEEANEFLAQFMGAPLPEMPPETPLEEAQELMYEAWETPSPRRRVQLAKQALQISPDCIDAYVALAESDAKNVRQAYDYYLQGVEAGNRLFADEFEEMVGHFWGITRTRPYMRALSGLAETLWLMGQKDASIKQYQELLRLNPGDNQGNRYILLHHLLEHGLPEEIDALLAMYPDDAQAAWNYNYALYLFRHEGDSAAANAKLATAMRWNKHVPDYLLGNRTFKPQAIEYMTMGGEDEAMLYVQENLPLWQQTAGALTWLQAQT